MARRIVDLSMPVHPDMLTFPRVPPPALCVYESHEQFAERIGAAAYGVDSLTGELPRSSRTTTSARTSTRASTSSRPPAGPRRSRSSSASPTASCSTSAIKSGYVITADDVKRELRSHRGTAQGERHRAQPDGRAGSTTPRSATAPTIRA